MNNSLSMTDFQMCCETVVVCYAIKRVFDYLDDKEVMMTYSPSTDQVELLTSKTKAIPLPLSSTIIIRNSLRDV